jgi:hypothetical protein
MTTQTSPPTTGDSNNRKDIKRQRREEQLAQRARLEALESRKRRLIWGGGIAAAVIALGALGVWLFGPTGGPPIQSPQIQGQVHIERGQSHPPYNSVPPTSGWHYTSPAPWGVSREPILAEIFVHNLEHGGIVISHDCPAGCAETITKLEALVNSYPSKVLLMPYPGLADTGHPIALTAWGKLAYVDTVDEGFIRSFIARFKDKGPEFVPD